jgi:hypothetical protein
MKTQVDDFTFLTRRFLRNVAVVDLLVTILYLCIRDVIPSVNNYAAGLSGFLHFLAILCAFGVSKSEMLGKSVLEAATFFYFLALIVDIYVLSETFRIHHAWITIVWVIWLCVQDVLILLLLMYIWFTFPLTAWKDFFAAIESNYINQWDYPRSDTIKRFALRTVVELVFCVEFPVTLLYAVNAGYFGPAHPTGWLFLFHILSPAVVFVFGRNDPKLLEGNYNIGVSGILLFLDLIYVISDASNDELAILYGMQCLLLTCALVNLIFFTWYEVKRSRQVLSRLDRVTIVFDRCFPLLSTSQVALVGGYFIFSNVTQTGPVLWSILLHIPCFFINIVIMDEVSTWILLIYSSGLFLHDFIIAGLYPGYELAFSILLSIVDSFYIASAIVLILFMDEKIKFTVQNTWFGLEYESDKLLIRVKRARFYVIQVLQRVWIIEAAALYTLLVIMVFQLDGYGTHPWYQWFYVVHIFPIFAAAMCVFSAASFEISLVFLLCAAAISFVADFFLIFFLLPETYAPLIAIQFIFIIIDIANIMIYFLISDNKNGNEHVIAYNLVYTHGVTP